METIVDLIEKSCRAFSGKAALRHKVDEQWKEIAYHEMRTASDRVAAGLRMNGFKAGDHAALLAPSSPRWIIAYLGILKAGGICVPIDKELKSIELRHVLSDCEASILFTERPYFDTVHEMVGDLPSLRQIVMLNPAPVAEGGEPSTASATERHLGLLREQQAPSGGASEAGTGKKQTEQQTERRRGQTA
ncbi:MAG TPA: AMP-binding protein, partial [Desulfuromonadaceae bacterium]